MSFFSLTDRLQWESLNRRWERGKVINANIANAETPGFRALGYDFEEQLQEVAGVNRDLALRVSNPRHKQHAFTQADGSIQADVYVQPRESLSHDGNTVDVDREMGQLAHNQILYRTAVETINRKIALLKYAISGG